MHYDRISMEQRPRLMAGDEFTLADSRDNDLGWSLAPTGRVSEDGQTLTVWRDRHKEAESLISHEWEAFTATAVLPLETGVGTSTIHHTRYRRRTAP